jgi:uncharacterized RDD family membrane protein YckC
VDLEDRIVTATPEGVSVELVLAGAGSRGVAILLDTLVQGAILLTAGLIASLVEVGSASVAPSSGLVATGVLSVLVLLDVLGYFVILEMLTGGRSLGKLAVGLRVVRLDGRPVGFGPSLVRNVVRLADYGLFLLGLWMILGTKRHQRLGDLAAGTIVIRERRAASTRRTGAPGVLAGSDPAVVAPVASAFGIALDASGWDVSAVTAEQVAVAERFLRSRWGYAPAPRARLAARLANLIAPQVAGAPRGLVAEQLLEGVVASKRGGGWVLPVAAPPPQPPRRNDAPTW